MYRYYYQYRHLPLIGQNIRRSSEALLMFCPISGGFLYGVIIHSGGTSVSTGDLFTDHHHHRPWDTENRDNQIHNLALLSPLKVTGAALS